MFLKYYIYLEGKNCFYLIEMSRSDLHNLFKTPTPKKTFLVRDFNFFKEEDTERLKICGFNAYKNYKNWEAWQDRFLKDLHESEPHQRHNWQV